MDMSAKTNTVAILQPGYLPWLGFFDQMQKADVFVYLDDVQFDKHGWRNRNRIKSSNGQACWLTVPIRHRGKGKPLINEVEIDGRSRWTRKHIETLQQSYAAAPYLEPYLGQLTEILSKDWEQLIELNWAITRLLMSWLNIKTPIVWASAINVNCGSTERLVQICKELDATCYLTGDAARAYLDIDLFSLENIDVTWHDYLHPQYPQLHGDFLPYLSVIDLILNCGDSSSNTLKAAHSSTGQIT